jgi:pimeloyl-ACP methyl ester carboxylesterase
MITPDLRGFGTAYDQLGSLEEISIAMAADDVVELLNERGIQKAIIGGISRGGYIALAFAHKYPDRLQALLLFDTRANPADDKEKANWAETVDRIQREGISAAVDAMKTRLLGPTTLRDNPALIERVNAMIRAQKPDAVAAAAKGMANREDARPWLSGIAVPTLAMAGVDDVAFENTMAIAAGIPEAEFVAVPDAGHLPIVEQPDFVNGVIGRYLDRVAPSGMKIQ